MPYLPDETAFQTLGFRGSTCSGQRYYPLPDKSQLWYVTLSHYGFALGRDTGAKYVTHFAGCCFDKAAFWQLLLAAGYPPPSTS